MQASLATYARDQLNKQLPSGLRARVETSIAVEVDDPTDDDVVTYFPDVHVLEPLKSSHSTGSRTTATADEPLLLDRVPEPETLRSVRIMTGDGGELVTAIEFLSPSNKIGKSGRDFYRMKQEAILSAGSSLVEIDLIRAGRHVMAVQLTRLPRHARKTYKAVVVRGWRRDRAEFYSLPIQSKLPVISIPLRKTDLDAKLDLQSLIELAYENGGYDVIDYAGRLEPALPADDNTWADELLKAAGKR